jgi:adenine-specific DNA-methyltransferase
MDGNSLDILDDNLQRLKQLFPEVFAEGKIDWERLKALFSNDINFANERYVLNWAGKSDAFKTLQLPTSATLKPVKEESVRFNETENIFIEGENLEVLKVLQKSYYGKIKCIIIDPPYNTGSDSFIYPDKFSEKKEDYLKRVGDTDEEGLLMKEGLFRRNSKENGQYHSNWLSMMYPRLFLAKNLLRDDGVIFVHIDDNEVHNLRLMMNEIFGEENFVECITWNKRVPKNDKGIGNIHEYIIIFVKDYTLNHEFIMQKKGLEEIEELVQKLKKQKLPLPESEKEIKRFYNKKGYDRGITLYNSLDKNYKLWGKINLSWPNANTFGPRYEVKHPKSGKIVKIPDRGWRWKEETFNDAAKIIDGVYQNIIELHDGSFMCGRIWFDKDENTQPSSVNYLDDVGNFLLRSVISLKSDGGIEVENLFEGKSIFSYPKPTSLSQILIKSLKSNDDGIILDFFGGSATTAHAVLELNKEDGGNRKFILVQLPEPCEETSEAYKAGYKTIAEIAKERIRRVINKIEKEKGEKPELFDKGTLDLGFKVFKLSPSNFKIWRSAEINDGNLETQLNAFVTPAKEGSEKENILYELMLKAGCTLTDSLEYVIARNPEGKTKQSDVLKKKKIASVAALPRNDDTVGYFKINNGELIIALDAMNTELVESILEAKPKKVITLDSLFTGNDQLKTNTVLQMKDAGIEFRTI